MKDENVRLTEEFILKGHDLEKIKKENTKNARKYSGYFEDIDFNKGCTISPKTDSEDGFLYIASYVDTYAHLRPEGFQFMYYDKKIGVSYDVESRMKKLTEDIKLGRRNKLKNVTTTPLAAKAFKCWRMSLNNAYRIEYFLHKLMDERNIDGEWFTDYYNDLIDIVEREINKFVDNGAHVELYNMDEDLAENIHRFEKIHSTKEVVEEPLEYVVYKL